MGTVFGASVGLSLNAGAGVLLVFMEERSGVQQAVFQGAKVV